MGVLVSKKGKLSRPILSGIVRQRALRMLASLGLADAELSILLTDDPTIHALNKAYRGKDKPTDVLAFSMREEKTLPAQKGATVLLGDVVISLDTAAKQAVRHGGDVLVEVTQLLAHGLLHLVGYDHQTDFEEKEMKQAQRALFRAAENPPSRPSTRVKRDVKRK